MTSFACPALCSRDNVGVENLAVEVEGRVKTYPQAFEVAVMGYAVNGPASRLRSSASRRAAVAGASHTRPRC